MRPSPGDFIRSHFASLDVLDWAQLVLGALMLVSAVFGAIALVRAWREDGGDGGRPSMTALRRWVGATTALALLSCVLAIAALAYQQWVGHVIAGQFAQNCTPADLAGPLLNANMGLAAGLLIGALGLLLGWTLEWFADGLEER